MQPQNIFSIDPRLYFEVSPGKLFPEVYIIGTGPNGTPYHNRIKPLPNILINKAIMIPDIEGLFWFSAAPGFMDTEWCLEAALCYWRRFIKDIPPHKVDFTGAPYPLFSSRIIHQTPVQFEGLPVFYFHEGTSFHGGGMGLEPVCLRPGAGSVGAALQFLYLTGIRKVVLVGVDMKGIEYFDGTANEEKRSINPDGTWTQLPMLQRLIDYLTESGMEITTLSDTMLKVKREDDG